jgi:hypothetical protein
MPLPFEPQPLPPVSTPIGSSPGSADRDLDDPLAPLEDIDPLDESATDPWDERS